MPRRRVGRHLATFADSALNTSNRDRAGNNFAAFAAKIALAQHFGNLALSGASSTDHRLVGFTAPLVGLITYPVVVAVAAAVAFLVAVLLLWRHRHCASRPAAGGVLAPMLAGEAAT